ncbi:hypothetical protein RAS2_27160 [Phycisphaerae bacterium RAS2]|nr:hypothetical protein RAS2_27160 [Phycisphaerae bacterium RAS2]
MSLQRWLDNESYAAEKATGSRKIAAPLFLPSLHCQRTSMKLIGLTALSIAYMVFVVEVGLKYPSIVLVTLLSLTIFSLVAAFSREFRRWRMVVWVRLASGVASLLLVLLWVLSNTAHVCIPYSPRDALALGDGCLSAISGLSPDGTPLASFFQWHINTLWVGQFGSSQIIYEFGYSEAEYVPTGSITLGILLPTLLLWLIRRRDIPSWCCQQCEYNLTSNVSGKCPECGAHISKKKDCSITAVE